MSPTTRLMLIAAALAAPGALARSQDPLPVRTVVSREVGLYNTRNSVPGLGTRTVVSREVSIFNSSSSPRPAPTRTVASRELSMWTPVADLGVAALAANPIEDLPIRNFSVTWRVVNGAGAGTARGGWVDRLYLSTNGVIDAQDTLLGEFEGAAPLAPGASYERTETVRRPLRSGTYKLILDVDADRTLGETNRLNNVVVDDEDVVVLEPLPCDLVVSDVTAPTGLVLAGSTTRLSWVVTNTSENPTSVTSWFDTLYVTSGDSASTFLDGVVFKNNFTNPRALLPGESYLLSSDVRLPAKIQGTFRAAVYCDSGGNLTPGAVGSVFAQRETDETNNLALSEPFDIAISKLQPDLIVTGMSFLTEASGARRFEVSYTVLNDGSAPTDSGHWIDTVELSRDGTLLPQPGDILVGSRSRPGAPLGPDESEEVTVSGVLPADASGTFRVRVSLDVTRKISEFGAEDNNVALSEPEQQVIVFASPPIDLTPTALTVQPTGFPGHPLALTWSVRNDGAPPLDLPLFWWDEVWLSEDAILDRATDRRISARPAGTRPGPDGTLELPPYTAVDSPLLPIDLAEGTYRAILAVDAFDGAYEGDDPVLGENNNLRVSTPIEVATLATDLAIETNFDAAHQVPRSGVVGRPLALSWRVSNAGAVATPPTGWADRVYFSSDATIDRPGDLVLTSRTRAGPLAPKASYIVESTGAVPFVPAGEYFLLFSTDDSSAIAELPPGEDNNVVAVPFTVSPDAADLVVPSVSAPKSAVGGAMILIQWTVRNAGSLATNRNAWDDRIYLSIDETLDASDRLIGSKYRGQPLAALGEYTTSTLVTLPVDASGMFHVLVEADGPVPGRVFESDEGNNGGSHAMALNVDPLLTSRLVVSNVAVAGAVRSGQTIDVSWRVTNEGEGPTTSASWNDAVYLSTDTSFDPRADAFLAEREYAGGILAPGGSYDAGLRADVPIGVSGTLFVLVVADNGNANAGEVTIDFQEDPVDVALPPPTDLEPVAVAVPAAGVLGEPVHLEWRVANTGSATVEGRWRDALFLSTDETFDLDDTPLGVVESRLATPLAPSAEASFAADVPLRDVTPGSYHVLVRVDVFNEIPEDDETDNLAAMLGTIAIDAPELVLDGDAASFVLDEGSDRYFALETPALRTVRLTLDLAGPEVWTELYVRFGAVPTPAEFDVRALGVGQADQELVIPDTQEGTYYVLVRNTRGSFRPGDEDATLAAVTVPFSVTSVTPAVLGDRGRVTLTVLGSRFETDGDVLLERPGEAPIPVRRLELIDASRLRATFLLDGAPHGLWDVVVTKSGDRSARLAGAVRIETAVPPVLAVSRSDPPPLREGAGAGTLNFLVSNRGNVDADYVFLLNALEETSGRSIVGLGGSGVVNNTLRDGLLRQTALTRSVAPGASASLSVTARAGVGATDIPLGQAVVALSTERFLFLQRDAAESARQAVLRSPETVLEERRGEIVNRAQSAAAWLDAWYEDLEAAGLVDGEDVLDLVLPAAPTAGVARCASSSKVGELPAFCDALEAMLCAELGARALEIGADATGAFATPPAALGGPCSLDGLVSCSSCTIWSVKSSIDPNEKTGNEGSGDENIVPRSNEVGYRIYFENEPNASSPAARVEIRDPLDPALNPGSFRVGHMAFGAQLIDVPPNRAFFQRTVPFGEEGLVLTVTSAIDVTGGKNEAVWIFQTIETATGLPPTDADRGFLPPSLPPEADPDRTDPRGKGWVEFTATPKPTVLGTIIIKNKAKIKFDANGTIDTNTVTQTIDGGTPIATMRALPAVTADPVIDLIWDGEDSENGSGIESYSVWVSVDGGPFAPFLVGTTATSATFTGESGHSYGFAALALDHAGNEEPLPTEPEAVVFIASGDSLFRRGDSNVDGVTNIADAQFTLNSLFLGGPLPECYDAADVNDDGAVNIADPNYLLNFLFLGGPVPPAPGMATCGPDGAEDTLPPCLDPREVCE